MFRDHVFLLNRDLFQWRLRSFVQERSSGPLKPRNLEKKKLSLAVRLLQWVVVCHREGPRERRPQPNRARCRSLLTLASLPLCARRGDPAVPSGWPPVPRSLVDTEWVPLRSWQLPGRGACTPFPLHPASLSIGTRRSEMSRGAGPAIFFSILETRASGI